jgi:multiple sugar transport system permease protein
MWRLIFFEAGGVLNDILVGRLHLAPRLIMWLSDRRLARMSVTMTTVWKNAPWAALLLLAGLKTIPRELIEAARVDGAGMLARFRYITLPMLAPVMLVVLMLRGMGEVQTFGQILTLTRGGPGSATKIISLYTYRRFFEQGSHGYGSTLVLFLLLLTVLIGGTFAYILSRQEAR